jgi:hypothetical protein
MATLPPPRLTCRRLPSFQADRWDSIRTAFAQADVAALGQAWLPHPDPAFKPATVRTGWTGTDLAVLAEMDDDDIANRARRLNERTYELGDVFEIFLKPEGQDRYFEIHVTPENQKLQLRFPRPGAIREKPKDPAADPLAPFLFEDPLIRSLTLVEAARARWSVLALVPLAFIHESGPVRPGTVWRFSFSRYDYTQGRPKPVISSTSPHAVADFHRTEDYGFLTFA